ncbi:cyclophilin-like fold protein [Clostridium sp.]|uniref:cyclophilin-like fold protein n=1 Tax=Clostridium sp. TaxID=1506 RepID=UPI002850A56B|nr:cyclophilin-like fold protein [Clostridium sp.]MDR3596319.1 cyclophilin-like fold protein [Clostridium sp.]
MFRHKGTRYEKLLVLLFLTLFTTSITGCFKESRDENKQETKQIQNSSGQTDTAKLEASQSDNNENLKGEINLKDTRIKIKIKDQELIAVMEDNPTTMNFLNMLPLTMSFKDFAGAEKITYPPSKMSTQDAPNGYTPKKGDITCYSPWGNLAVFYKDREYASGLIYMGHIESGIEVLEGMSGDFDAVVTIEK